MAVPDPGGVEWQLFWPTSAEVATQSGSTSFGCWYSQVAQEPMKLLVLLQSCCCCFASPASAYILQHCRLPTRWATLQGILIRWTNPPTQIKMSKPPFAIKHSKRRHSNARYGHQANTIILYCYYRQRQNLNNIKWANKFLYYLLLLCPLPI